MFLRIVPRITLEYFQSQITGGAFPTCLHKTTTLLSSSKVDTLHNVTVGRGTNNKRRYGAGLLTFGSITAHEKCYRVLSLYNFNALSDSKSHYHRDFCSFAKETRSLVTRQSLLLTDVSTHVCF